AKCLMQYNKQIHSYQTSFMKYFRDMIGNIQHIERNFEYNYVRFQERLHRLNQEIASCEKERERDAKNWFSSLVQKITHHEQMLLAYDPHLKLKQGYSIVKDTSGNVI